MNVTIDVVSDVMCPWCYIGKRRLEQALAMVKTGEVTVRWRPYQLDPTLPPEGRDRRDYLEKKFGGPERARQIYAGGDIFLMPSRFEPCGLGQLMAMRYGNIPVVRTTGGLKDTVTDYTQDKTGATGFAFEEASPAAFRAAVAAASEVWDKPASWKRIMGNAVRRDSSWDASASTYLELYSSLKD